MWIILAYTAVCLVFMLFIILLIADLILGGPKPVSRNRPSIRKSSNWVPTEPSRKISSQAKVGSRQNRSKSDPGAIRRMLGRTGNRQFDKLN